MTKTQHGFIFQSTGREIDMQGLDGISIDKEGNIQIGSEQALAFDIHDEGTAELETTEKRELATYMIAQWQAFLSNT